MSGSVIVNGTPFVSCCVNISTTLPELPMTLPKRTVINFIAGPQASVRAGIKKFTEQREMMCRELDDMSDIFEYEKPLGAYYIMVKVKRPASNARSVASAGWPQINSFKLVIKILREANVIVIPGAAFGPTGEGHIRFSFAGKPENITRGFARLKKWVKKWRSENYKL